MKKIFLLAIAVASLASCTTVHETARTTQIKTTVLAGVSADLEIVGSKISYTYKPTAAVRRGGVQNCINAAVSGALMKNGNGDVLVECQKAVVERSSFWASLFGFRCSKVKAVTVTGYPAVYKNFKLMDQETAIKAAATEAPAIKQSTVLGVYGK